MNVYNDRETKMVKGSVIRIFVLGGLCLGNVLFSETVHFEDLINDLPSRLEQVLETSSKEASFHNRYFNGIRKKWNPDEASERAKELVKGINFREALSFDAFLDDRSSKFSSVVMGGLSPQDLENLAPDQIGLVRATINAHDDLFWRSVRAFHKDGFYVLGEELYDQCIQKRNPFFQEFNEYDCAFTLDQFVKEADKCIEEELDRLGKG